MKGGGKMGYSEIISPLHKWAFAEEIGMTKILHGYFGPNTL
jgi:hypothetical protein